jgi:hypothetical protein
MASPLICRQIPFDHNETFDSLCAHNEICQAGMSFSGDLVALLDPFRHYRSEARSQHSISLRGENARSCGDMANPPRLKVERPTGPEGWSEEQLATIVTRDCMVGTVFPQVE